MHARNTRASQTQTPSLNKKNSLLQCFPPQLIRGSYQPPAAGPGRRRRRSRRRRSARAASGGGGACGRPAAGPALSDAECDPRVDYGGRDRARCGGGGAALPGPPRPPPQVRRPCPRCY
eukprot:2560378-Rhodomonas_salina.1